MSRGHGKIQISIIETIKQDFGNQVQQNYLIWHLAEKEKKIKTLNIDSFKTGFIDNSFNKSIQRAIIELGKEEVIQIQPRKLTSLDQFISYYPFKTTKLEIKELRINLLPLIKFFLEETGPKYGPYREELFLIEKIKKEKKEEFRRASEKWISFEKKIFRILAQTEENRDKLISIIIKGRQLFMDSKAEYGRALFSLLNEDKKLIPIISEIHAFYSEVIKNEDWNHVVMKSQIYAVANLAKGSRSSLNEDFKKFLYEKKSGYVSNLPGHSVINHESRGRLFGLKNEINFSKLLDKLIDRHSFAPFNFLSFN